MEWKTIERPGHIGDKRYATHYDWNRKYGEGKWKLAWQWGNSVIEESEALQLYEDGYYEFLRSRKDILDWLVSTASDVYDDNESNVNSKFDYKIQETLGNHLQDIAVRRSVMRLGREFKGNHLMQIRGKKSEGGILVPYMVPFHLPQMIIPGELINYAGQGSWWLHYGLKNSIEEFYQQNKILQVKNEL